MWICLYIGLILTNLIFYPFLTGNNLVDTQYYYTPKEILFVLTALMVTALSNFKSYDYYLKLKNPWLGAFFIYFLLSFTWKFFYPLLFGMDEKNSVWVIWAIRPFICFLSAYFLMKTLVEYGQSIKPWVNLSKVFAFLCLGISIFAVIQWCGLDSIVNSHYQQRFHTGALDRSQMITTFMGERTMTAAVIAILSPYLLMFKGFWYKLFYGISFIAIILAESTSAIIAFSSGLFIYLALTRNKKGLVIFILLSICILFICNSLYKDLWNVNGRIGLWSRVIEDTYHTNSLLFGKGFGSFAQSYNSQPPGIPIHYREIILFAHNEIIQLLNEGGLVGVFIFIGYIINILWRSFFKYLEDPTILLICNLSAVIAVLIIAQFSFPFWFAPTAMITVLILSSMEFLLLKRG